MSLPQLKIVNHPLLALNVPSIPILYTLRAFPNKHFLSHCPCWTLRFLLFNHTYIQLFKCFLLKTLTEVLDNTTQFPRLVFCFCECLTVWMPMPYAKASCDAQKILCILYLKLFPHHNYKPLFSPPFCPYCQRTSFKRILQWHSHQSVAWPGQ